MKRQKDIINAQFGFVAVIGIGMIITVLWFFRQDLRYVKYTNKRAGFSMKYPASWDLAENTNGATAIFFSKLEGDLDYFKENVNVVVQDVSGSVMELDQYTAMAIEQVALIFGDRIRLIESEPDSLGGRAAHRIVYIGRGSEEDTDMKIMHIWALNGDKAYQFTYTTFASQYDNYIKKATSMKKSFKFL